MSRLFSAGSVDINLKVARVNRKLVCSVVVTES